LVAHGRTAARRFGLGVVVALPAASCVHGEVARVDQIPTPTAVAACLLSRAVVEIRSHQVRREICAAPDLDRVIYPALSNGAIMGWKSANFASEAQ
jgi:hypothetical protein